MKWFDTWFAKKVKQAWDNAQNEPQEANIGLAINKVGRARSLSKRESDELGTEPITFKMFKASGGWAIEFRQYDNRNDRVDNSLYVVNDEEELGKHISQIITMEALKR